MSFSNITDMETLVDRMSNLWYETPAAPFTSFKAVSIFWTSCFVVLTGVHLNYYWHSRKPQYDPHLINYHRDFFRTFIIGGWCSAMLMCLVWPLASVLVAITSPSSTDILYILYGTQWPVRVLIQLNLSHLFTRAKRVVWECYDRARLVIIQRRNEHKEVYNRRSSEITDEMDASIKNFLQDTSTLTYRYTAATMIKLDILIQLVAEVLLSDLTELGLSSAARLAIKCVGYISGLYIALLVTRHALLSFHYRWKLSKIVKKFAFGFPPPKSGTHTILRAQAWFIELNYRIYPLLLTDTVLFFFPLIILEWNLVFYGPALFSLFLWVVIIFHFVIYTLLYMAKHRLANIRHSVEEEPTTRKTAFGWLFGSNVRKFFMYERSVLINPNDLTYYESTSV